MKRLIKIAIIVAVMFFACTAFAGGGNSMHKSVTKVELAEIYVHIEEAVKWLGYARQEPGDNTFNIKTCREELSKAPGATLQTIGTSENELHKLLIAGYLTEAKKWWKYAENSSDDNSLNIKFCLEYLEKAGATIESIGGSREKVYQLLYDGYTAEAKKWLEYYIKSEDGKLESRFFLEALHKAAAVQKLIEVHKKTEDMLEM